MSRRYQGSKPGGATFFPIFCTDMDLPDDLLGMVLLRCAAAGRAARVSVAWARVASAHRVGIAAALRLGDRLARRAARLGDEAELEAIRLTIGTTDGRIALVAAAHQQWAVLAWCARHAIVPDGEDDQRLVAAHAKMAGVDLPWGEVVVWDDLAKRRTTCAELYDDLLPHCIPGRLKEICGSDRVERGLPTLLLMGTILHRCAVGVSTTMQWRAATGRWRPADRASFRVDRVCNVMTDVRPLGRYAVRLTTASPMGEREWRTAVPAGAIVVEDVLIRFEAFDGAELPAEVGIEFCGWDAPHIFSSTPFVCDGVTVYRGDVHQTPRPRWLRCEHD